MDDLLIFDWDEEKNRSNIRKHGVDFATAARVFQDENRIEIYDLEHSDDEDRYKTIGMVNELLFVIYTERGVKIRLISARRANERERRPMIVTYTLKKGQPLTPEQTAMLKALKDRPIVYDEDCPESTPEELERFRLAAVERNRRQAREAAERRREVS